MRSCLTRPWGRLRLPTTRASEEVTGRDEWVQVGREAGLRPIIDEFVDGCFDDLMIGFLFRTASRDRVKEFEFQHAAAHLGGDVSYGGRPIDRAHAKHRIMGGHFDRRLTILRQTLQKHSVPPTVIERWLAYHQSLRPMVTSNAAGECR